MQLTFVLAAPLILAATNMVMAESQLLPDRDTCWERIYDERASQSPTEAATNLPARCEAVFAVIDTASNAGTDNDATAVTFFELDRVGQIPLLIFDWDIVQIEGALLET